MIAEAVVKNIWLVYTILAFLVSVSFGLFLFWRSGRRELVEGQLLFDSFFIFLAGSILGRVVDFFIRFDYYQWSWARLVFFNVYHGFDFLGALIGGILAVFLYLRAKKQNYWFIFDLATGGLVFAIFFYKLLQFILEKFILKINGVNIGNLYIALSYLLIFWAIKKFEKKKKHHGFFASFFLVSFSILNIIVLYISGNHTKGHYYYVLISMSTVIIFISINWYLLAKRKIQTDLKTLFAVFLLVIFKIKRLLTNVREADNTAKIIILTPLYIAKWLYFLVKYLGQEVYVTFLDILSAFGLSK